MSIYSYIQVITWFIMLIMLATSPVTLMAGVGTEAKALHTLKRILHHNLLKLNFFTLPRESLGKVTSSSLTHVQLMLFG